MLAPILHASCRPLYLVGNTPAINLTAALPQGIDADILSLGCGDLRHVLFTCYAEQHLPKRKLDITCCDIEENIIARNILVLSLILDGNDVATPEQIWRIYYNLYLDDNDMQILNNQAQQLLGRSLTLDEWHDSRYGEVIRICDTDTLNLLRVIWSTFFSSATAKDDAQYKDKFEAAKKSSRAFKDLSQGEDGFSFTAIRAAAPLYQSVAEEFIKANNRCWDTGVADPETSDAVTFPNPMFATGMSERAPLAFPSDPLLSFHLAPAAAKLTELSPLRLESSDGKDRLVATAQLMFGKWVESVREALAESRLIVRFVAADCFSLCHTLQHNIETHETTANWYRREVGFKVFELSETDYGKEGKAPRQFDFIDSSNISDYHGVLNMLISTGPLLKDEPWAAVNTDLMLRGAADDSARFEALLVGHTKTVAILLGLMPIEYWTNAMTYMVSDELFLSMLESSRGDKGVGIQARLAWKNAGTPKISVKAQELANLAHQVYLDMFQNENISKLTRQFMDMHRGAWFPKFHRGSFTAFIKILCKRLSVNAAEVSEMILEKVVEDTSLTLGTNNSQAFCVDMQQMGIWDIPFLQGEIQHNNIHVGFCKWKEIPPVVAVTLKIPAKQWQRVFKYALEKTADLMVEGNVLCDSPTGGYHNIFADTQISFGKVVTSGSTDSDEFSVEVQENPERFAGHASMVATFYVSTGGLQSGIPWTKVSLRMKNTPQNIILFAGLLGPEMSIFDSKLQDEKHVFITKLAPGHSAYPVVCGSLPPPSSLGDLSTSTGSSATFSLNLDPQSGNITTVTGHVDITTEQGKQLLADKVPIEVQQVSPSTIEIVFGKQTLVLPVKYPAPVLASASKTRIARKSCYVEVIAPLATPITSPCLEDYVFPTVLSKANIPATLSIPHLSLDTLPIIDISDKSAISFINPYSALIFSNRERALRGQVDTSGLSRSSRLNLKESIFTMLMLASGLQGGQTGLFAVSRPKDGVHILVFVSALRLDGASGGIVLDAAVLPFTRKLVDAHALDEFLLILRTLECATITVDDDELKLWKTILPALAERCRTWQHDPATCEYKDGKVPVSVEPGQPCLCSCGQGKIPEDYVSLPEWESAKKYATRVAISPLFASQFVESSGDVDMMKATAASEPPKERCRACGRTEGRDKGPLKKCMRCLEVKYCSVECQKKDWKKHRGECEEADIYDLD
ncbi:hypothetical protein OQA88_9666 [Cercophora sp. LCS_1]